MSSEPHTSTGSPWAGRRDAALTALIWLAVVAAVFWAALHVGKTLLMLIVAGLIAYALFPAARMLSRYVPRFLAVLLVYLGLLVGLGLVAYLLLTTAVSQISTFADQIRVWLTPGPNGQPSPLLSLLDQLGVTQDQINTVQQQLIAQTEGLVKNVVPLVGGVVNAVLDIVLTAILSVYLLVDGARLGAWLRSRAPVSQRARIDFLLDTQQRIVGGYIRGQLLISALVALLVTVGMFILGVPFAVLVGMLAFILAFVPVIGPMGRSVGIHPAVSLVALVAAGEVFGLWGALLATPLAGLLQAIAAYAWIAWRETHKEQFIEAEESTVGQAGNAIDPEAPGRVE
jgi:predicted PurR-regulated permease PerM